MQQKMFSSVVEQTVKCFEGILLESSVVCHRSDLHFTSLLHQCV